MGIRGVGSSATVPFDVIRHQPSESPVNGDWLTWLPRREWHQALDVSCNAMKNIEGTRPAGYCRSALFMQTT
jgi:hypothetical protein